MWLRIWFHSDRWLHWCLVKLPQSCADFIFPTCVLLLRGTQITAYGTSCKETWGRSFRRAGVGVEEADGAVLGKPFQRGCFEREHSQKSPSLLTGKLLFPQVWKHWHVFSHHFLGFFNMWGVYTHGNSFWKIKSLHFLAAAIINKNKWNSDKLDFVFIYWFIYFRFQLCIPVGAPQL